MSLTWTPALAAPASLSVSAVAGGTIPDGTYYVRVCAANKESYFSSDYVILRSPPSTEQSVVLGSGNNSMDISWGAVTGATHYSVYITTLASGDDRWKLKKLKRLSDNNQLAATTALTSISLTTALQLGGGLDTFVAVEDLPGGIDKALGKGYLTISDTGGTLTLDDLVAAIDAGYVYYDGYTFIVMGGIIISASTTGSLSIQNGKRIIPLQGMLKNNSDSFSLSMTRCDYYCALWSLRMPFIRMTVANCLIRGTGTWSGLEQVYYAYGGDNYVYIYSSFVDGGNNIYGAIGVGMQKNSTLTKAIATDRLIVYDTDVLVTLSSFDYYAPNKSNQAKSDNIIVRDCTFSSSTYGLYKWVATVDMIPVYDCLFPNFPSNNRPVVWWANTGQGFELYRSVALRITDEDNNPIVGATVTLKDSSGNNAFTPQTTGVDGSITTQDVLVTVITWLSGTTTSTYTDKGDFTLTVEAAGYKTYTKVITTPTEKIDWEIALGGGGGSRFVRLTDSMVSKI